MEIARDRSRCVSVGFRGHFGIVDGGSAAFYEWSTIADMAPDFHRLADRRFELIANQIGGMSG
jgi:hypothetical protein